MRFEDAEVMARGLMVRHGIGHWRFGWNRRKRALGLCRYGERRIELSAHFVVANEEPLVRDTILHEIAHALAGQRAGHGEKWKAVCEALGCKAERCDKGEAIMPAGRWQARCPGCGKDFFRYKRPPRRAKYWCKGCGPARGPVQFFMRMGA